MTKPKLVTKDGKPAPPKPPVEGSLEWIVMMQEAGYGGWGMMMPPAKDGDKHQ